MGFIPKNVQKVRAAERLPGQISPLRQKPIARVGIPTSIDQVTAYIVQRIYNRAADWSNWRIRRFLERPHD